MKAKLVDSMPTGNWIYEIKFDGYRALALRGGNETRVLSRNEKDLGGKFPEVQNSIAALDVQDAIRTQGLGLEGLIGKRSGSKYEPGKRTGAWVKIKLHQERECVIGGYTELEGSRKYFGALLVGFYEGKNFKFAGGVGTGFSEKLLRSLFDDLQK